MSENKYLFEKIERKTCDIVNDVVAIYKPMSYQVDAHYMYDGKTNVYFATSVARSYAFLVMHDMFCITYREIAKRARKSMSSVIKSVRRARQQIYVDPIFVEVHKQMSAAIADSML